MQMSSLSNWEYVSIVGHYNNLIYKESIDSRLLTRGYTQDQLDEMKRRQGRNNSMEIISCGLHIKGDLSIWNYPYFNYVVSLFHGYNDNNILPFEGPLSDQPGKIMDIFELLTQLKHEHQEKLHADQERQRKA